MSIKIFISYSHKDQNYLADDSLLGYLKGLESEDVEFWWDEKINAGEKWDEKIRLKLEETNIALVLVSQWFLDSHYCKDTEISSFLKSSLEKGLIIIPVILSACEWNRHEWLASRQFFPAGHETVEEHYKDPGKQKRLFAKIRESLRTHVEIIKKPGSIRTEPSPEPRSSDTAKVETPNISNSNDAIVARPRAEFRTIVAEIVVCFLHPERRDKLPGLRKWCQNPNDPLFDGTAAKVVSCGKLSEAVERGAATARSHDSAARWVRTRVPATRRVRGTRSAALAV